MGVPGGVRVCEAECEVCARVCVRWRAVCVRCACGGGRCALGDEADEHAVDPAEDVECLLRLR